MTQPEFRPQHRQLVRIKNDANTDTTIDGTVAVTPAALGCIAIVEHNYRDTTFDVVIAEGPLKGKWQTVLLTDLEPVELVPTDQPDVQAIDDNDVL